MALKAQAQFTNRYEAAYNMLQSNAFFNKNDWRKIAMGNDETNLDMYIDALGKMKNKDKKSFDEKYITQFQDDDTRLAALYNEAYASRLANDDRYQIDEYVTDENGVIQYHNGEPKTRKKTISEYEYNKRLIQSQNGVKRDAHIKQLAEEAKDPSGWFTAGMLVVDAGFGLMDFFVKLGALVKTPFQMMSKDKTFANDWFSTYDKNATPILQRLKPSDFGDNSFGDKNIEEALVELESQFTNLRDVDGNLTTFGRIATGVASTVGEMLGATITGQLLTAPLTGAAAGSGAAAKAAQIGTQAIQTASYYAPLAAYSMSEQYKEMTAKGYSVPTSKVLTNQLWKTGLEISIEMVLGKIFGATGIDKILLGSKGKVTKLLSKPSTLRGLGYFAKEALQEGTEEFLQEYSGFIVDKAYGTLVNESFTPEFNMQNFIDAAIIGAIISASHSSINVFTTKTSTLIDAEGNSRKLGKIASAYYKASIPTFLENLRDSQAALDSIIKENTSSHIAYQLDTLTKKKSEIESKLARVSTDAVVAETETKTEETSSDTKAESKTEQAPLDNESRRRLEKELEEVENEISSLSKKKESASGLSAISADVIEAFKSVYMSARAVQSFAGTIGDERMTKVAEILGRVEKMGEEGKFDDVVVVKARNEMVKELQLRGIHVSRSLIDDITSAGMTRIKKIFTREDVESEEASREELADFAKKVFEASKKRKKVVITKDGSSVAADDEIMAVPEELAKTGTFQAFENEAEKRLVKAILSYKLKGNVLEKVLSTYQAIYKADADVEEALYQLIFDEGFFFTMLTGETSKLDKNFSLADYDMYQFLASLSSIEAEVSKSMPSDVRNEVYSNKIKKVKKSMANAITFYLTIQPYADYNIAVLSKKQRDRILQIRQRLEVGNSIVLGKATKNVTDFFARKIDMLPISKEAKENLKKRLFESDQTTRRNALVEIDSTYKTLFYGAYDGKTYMPGNSFMNQAFNRLLYDTGLTVETMLEAKLDVEKLRKLYGGSGVKEIVKFFSDRLSNMTQGRYSLQLVTDPKTAVNAESGIFKSGNHIIRILDSKSSFTAPDSKAIRSVKEKRIITPAKPSASLLKEITDPEIYSKIGGYYSINDVINDPSTLSKKHRDAIMAKYHELTSDTVYMYLKSYFAKKGTITLSMKSDGSVVFVNLKKIEDVLASDFSIETVKKVIDGNLSIADLINPSMRTPLMEDTRLVVSDSPEYFTETVFAGDKRGSVKSVIRISKGSLSNIDQLKTEFAHELQHMIQTATMLNAGTSANTLSLFTSEVQKQIIQSIKKRVPELFKNATNQTAIKKIVNEFLYYGSGEVAAYGAEGSDVIDFYPVLIEEISDGIVRLTLPWGESFKSVSSGKKQMISDEQEFVKFYESVSELLTPGVKTNNDVESLFYSCVDSDEIRSLADKVFKSVKKYSNVTIELISSEEMRAITGKNGAGVYVEDGRVLYNYEHLTTLFEAGEIEILAETVLHELIHVCTVDAINEVKALLKGKKVSEIIDQLDERLKGALSLIKLYDGLKLKKIYDAKYGTKPLVEVYGMTNVYEFIAEFSSYDFRNYLKEQTLWEKIVSAIRSILGISNKDVLSVGQYALEQVLETEGASTIGNEMYFKPIDDTSAESVSKETKIHHSRHERSKGVTQRGYVGKRASKGTPLEPYAGRRIGLPLIDFIMRSVEPEYKGIDEGIREKIKDGTLYEEDLRDFIRECDPENKTHQLTFKLINETIFKNKHITSLQQLDEYVTIRAQNYYAIRVFMRETGKLDELADTDNPELYDLFLDRMYNSPNVSKKFRKIAERYNSAGVVFDSYLRILFMQHFDGSVDSAGYIAAVAKTMGYAAMSKGKWRIKGVIGYDSLDEEVGPGKDGDSKTSRLEQIPDEQDLRDAQSFIDKEDFELVLAAYKNDYLLEVAKMIKENPELSTYRFKAEVDKRLNSMRDELTNMAEHRTGEYAELLRKYLGEDAEVRYARFISQFVRELSGDKGFSTVEEIIEDKERCENLAKKMFRSKRNIAQNINAICRTIRRNLNDRERKLFLAENSDLFTEDFRVEPSLYKETLDSKTGSGIGVTRLKDDSVLLEIERRLKQLSKDVRYGVYSSKKSYDYKQMMEKKLKRMQREIAELYAAGSKETIKYVPVVISGETVEISSPREIPLTVRRFMDNVLETYVMSGPIAKSETQLLAGEDERHVRLNYNRFIEVNAQTLNNLTQNDVDELVEFYLTSTTKRNALYDGIEIALLGYFLKMSGQNSVSFTLSDAQRTAIESFLKDNVENAGVRLAVWNTVLKEIRPAETIHKAMLKACGIELPPKVEAELIMAINSGNLTQIKAAKELAYESAVEKYKGHKRTVFDRLLRYERMAMLSGPGTWVRNQVSNVMVEGGNRLSEVLGSLLPESKKHDKLKQYRIVGTKVSSGYQSWIKSAVIDNGLLDLISDGLIKYDIRRTKKVTVENQLTKLIISKIESDLFNEASGANRVSQFLQKAIAVAMSDKRSINRAFIRYLGKMMTEDGTDVSNGLSGEVMDTIAEAYTMAMQDYMHTSNFWNRLEGTIRSYLHKRFNPTTADGIYFLYKQVLPFANASWNWFMEGLNYTPVGLAKGIIQFCRLENTVNRMEEARQKGELVRSARFAEYLAKRNIGKGAIGTVGFGVGILLVALGKADFDEEDDKYKLVINAKDGPIYIDISELFGTNGITIGMSVAKNFVDMNGEFNYDNFMKLFASSFNTMFMDSTFADMYNTFRYSTSFGDYLTAFPMDVAGMFMPNFIKTIGNTFKKYNVTYSPGFLGQLERYAVQSFAPFSYLMPYQVNPYTGEPEVINEGWFGLNLINRYTPVKVKNYNFGDIERIAVSLGVSKGQLNGRYKIGDHKLNLKAEEVENLNEFYGKLNAQTLEDFMTNKTKYSVEDAEGKREELTYSKMTDKQKAAVIERIMSNNSGLAKVYILTSSGQYKYYANDSEYGDLRSAGVTTNVYRKSGKLEGFVKIN